MNLSEEGYSLASPTDWATKQEDRTRAVSAYMEDSLDDKLKFAAYMGAMDTYRGVKQLFGVDEEDMKKEQIRLESYLSDEEDGGSVLAAYSVGLIVDPAGWVIPGAKAKNVASAAKAGLKFGAVTGATGYVAEGQTRMGNTLMGMAGGGVLSPALFKTQHTLIPAMKKKYGDVIDESQFLANAGETIKKNTPDFLGRWFIDNYGLPEGYVKMKKDARRVESEWASRFNELAIRQSKLTPEEDAVLYRLITGEESKVPVRAEVESLNKESRKLVDDLGKELVDLKILDRATFEKNKGTYLHRTYRKPNTKQKKLVRDEKQLLVFGKEFLRRGKTEIISKSKVKEYTGKGWTVDDTPTKAGTVRVHRDWSPKERKQMGEIVSAAYSMATTGKLMSHDMAYYKLYDDIASDPSLARKLEKGEDVPDGWTKVSTDSVKGQGTVKRFGRLAGNKDEPTMIVRSDIYNDLKFASTFNNLKNSRLGRVHSNMLSWWKRGKTSLNPVVHMNNVMSNFVLYDLLDGSFKHIRTAASEMRGLKKVGKSQDYKDAESLGVFNADMMKNELTGHVGSSYRKFVSKEDTGMMPESFLDKLWENTKRGADYLKKTHLDDLYQAEDNLFRLALYKDRLAKGATKEEAAQFARRGMLDYEIDAPGIKIMRETGWPFIAYTYRVAPILAETALKRPWKLAKWAGILHGANWLGTDLSEGDLEEQRKKQAELNQTFEVFGGVIPGDQNTLIPLGSLGGGGQKYLDIARWIPGGDIMNIGNTSPFSVPGLPAPLQPSGASLGGIAKTLLGFDTYTGRTVGGVGSGISEHEIGDLSSGRLSILAKEFLPMYHQINGVLNAKVDGKSHPTKDDRTLGESLLNVVGVKIKTFEEDKMEKRISYKYKNKIASLKTIMDANKKSFRAGKMSRAEIEKINGDIAKEIKKISLELREVLK